MRWKSDAVHVVRSGSRLERVQFTWRSDRISLPPAHKPSGIMEDQRVLPTRCHLDRMNILYDHHMCTQHKYSGSTVSWRLEATMTTTKPILLRAVRNENWTSHSTVTVSSSDQLPPLHPSNNKNNKTGTVPENIKFFV